PSLHDPPCETLAKATLAYWHHHRPTEDSLFVSWKLLARRPSSFVDDSGGFRSRFAFGFLFFNRALHQRVRLALRQIDSKRRPAPFFARNRNRSMMVAHNRLHDRQSQTRAKLLCRVIRRKKPRALFRS